MSIQSIMHRYQWADKAITRLPGNAGYVERSIVHANLTKIMGFKWALELDSEVDWILVPDQPNWAAWGLEAMIERLRNRGAYIVEERDLLSAWNTYAGAELRLRHYDTDTDPEVRAIYMDQEKVWEVESARSIVIPDQYGDF